MRCVLICIIVFALSHDVAFADTGWGSLRGRFVLSGTLDGLLNDAVVVNAQSRGLANVVVMLRATENLKVHPSFHETSGDDVVLEVRNRRFEPRVRVVRTTQRLVIENTDDTGNNVHLSLFRNPAQNHLLPGKTELSFDFALPERNPIYVSCNIVSSMRALLVIPDHPYAAVTNVDGEFEIPKLPVGSWEFQAWHEKTGWIDAVRLHDRKEHWRKGRFGAEVIHGITDLGTIKIRSKLLRR